MTAARLLGPGVAYQSLAQLLRDAINQGEFANGRQLPTEAELVADYGVSRQTVRRALQELVAEGLVSRVRGRGTFAVSAASGQYLRSVGSVEDLLALSVDSVMEIVRPLQRRADVVAAGRLRADSDQVMTGLFRRLHDDMPFSVTEIYLPLAVGQRITQAGALLSAGEILPRTVISFVDETNPEPIAGAHQSITATAVPEHLAELLGCRPNAPVLRIDRLYFDAHGQPLELAVSHFNPERYSYRLELRRRLGTQIGGRAGPPAHPR
jgi:DNA-binding GntR family transcriptional regulator